MSYPFFTFILCTSLNATIFLLVSHAAPRFPPLPHALLDLSMRTINWRFEARDAVSPNCRTPQGLTDQVVSTPVGKEPTIFSSSLIRLSSAAALPVCQQSMVNHLVQRQAELLKLQGNECFKKGKLGAAIDAYTEVQCSLLEPASATLPALSQLLT